MSEQPPYRHGHHNFRIIEVPLNFSWDYSAIREAGSFGEKLTLVRAQLGRLSDLPKIRKYGIGRDALADILTSYIDRTPENREKLGLMEGLPNAQTILNLETSLSQQEYYGKLLEEALHLNEGTLTMP